MNVDVMQNIDVNIDVTIVDDEWRQYLHNIQYVRTNVLTNVWCDATIQVN
jgi:hypothetical protein